MESQTPFDLSNWESTHKYAMECLYEDYECYPDEPPELCHHRQNKYDRRIEMYFDKYNDLKESEDDQIHLYRMIRIPSKEHIDCANIGTYWSFEEAGVGVYGGTGKKHHDDKDVLLTGHVHLDGIDWKHGFESFLHYGPDQWECALHPNTPVTITSIYYDTEWLDSDEKWECISES